MFNPYQFIKNKKTHNSHKSSEISMFINLFLDKKIEPSQMAAWLMAVYFNGLNKLELNEYVNSIVSSNQVNN